MLIDHGVSVCDDNATKGEYIISNSADTLSIVFFLFSAENGGYSEAIKA